MSEKDQSKGFSPEDMEGVIERALGDSDLLSSEIPNIDLYIDQILTLVAEKNAKSSPRYLENYLTKTMINNYSKEGVILPIKGKKYTKEHIIQMLLIYSLKNSLSIGEINRLIQGVYREGFDGQKLTECYDRFIELKNESRRRAAKSAGDLITEEGLDLEESEDFCVALLGILATSAYLKAIAEEMLLARYPLPEAVKDEEKAKAKARSEEDKKKKTKAKEDKKEEKKAEKTAKAEKADG